MNYIRRLPNHPVMVSGPLLTSNTLKSTTIERRRHNTLEFINPGVYEQENLDKSSVWPCR